MLIFQGVSRNMTVAIRCLYGLCWQGGPISGCIGRLCICHVLGGFMKDRLPQVQPGPSKVPSRGLTYPTLGKGKSSAKCPFWGDMLVLWRVTIFKKEINLQTISFLQGLYSTSGYNSPALWALEYHSPALRSIFKQLNCGILPYTTMPQEGGQIMFKLVKYPRLTSISSV